jgi:hypothetical protein
MGPTGKVSISSLNLHAKVIDSVVFSRVQKALEIVVKRKTTIHHSSDCLIAIQLIAWEIPCQLSIFEELKQQTERVVFFY